ncbi:MAG: hypothetical protein ACTSU2_10535 [Promethearchaeota archaeon]
MDTLRFIIIYIVDILYGVSYLIIGLKILSRRTNPGNIILKKYLFAYYISIFITFCLNAVYAAIYNEIIVELLHTITIFIGLLGSVLLNMFNLIVYKSVQIFNKDKQKDYFLKYFLLILIIHIIFFANIEINETTSWKPKWNLIAFLSMILLIFILMVNYYYYAIKILFSIRNIVLKKRWIFYMLGISFTYIWEIATGFNNFLFNNKIAVYIFLICLLASFFSPIFVYYGLIKELNNN